MRSFVLAILVAAVAATFAAGAMTLGSHGITAFYDGDDSSAASTSPTLTQTVNLAATTTSRAGGWSPARA